MPFRKSIPYRLSQIVFQIAEVPPDVGVEATSPDPHDQPIFNAKGSSLIHQPSALTDKPVPDAVERLEINLFRGSRFDKSHCRPCDGLCNRRSIDRVGLVRLHIGLRKSRRNDPPCHACSTVQGLQHRTPPFPPWLANARGGRPDLRHATGPDAVQSEKLHAGRVTQPIQMGKTQTRSHAHAG